MALIEIIGDDNYVLINDTYRNMIINTKFRGAFSADASTIVQGGNFYYSFTSSEQVIPQLAVNSSFAVTMRRYSISGNTHTWHVACESAGIGQTVDFYLLFLPKSVPDANGILQLFNAQGELVFDSGHDYCRAETNYISSINDPDGHFISVPAGRKFAHLLTAPSFIYRVDRAGGSGGGTGGYPTNLILGLRGLYMSSGRVSARTFQMTYQYVVFPPTQPPPFGTTINTPATHLIIDVTGL